MDFKTADEAELIKFHILLLFYLHNSISAKRLTVEMPLTSLSITKSGVVLELLCDVIAFQLQIPIKSIGL